MLFQKQPARRLIDSVAVGQVVLGTGVAFAVVILAASLALPRPAPYAYHMSFNENWYSGVALGQIHDELMPPGLVLAASVLPFDAVVNLRVVGILAAIGMVIVAWRLVGRETAVLLGTLPWVVMWSGRAQPDALMTAMLMSGLLLADEGSSLPLGFLGGLLTAFAAFVKPVALLAIIPMLLTRGAKRSLTWYGFGAGLLPVAAWIITRPGATWAYHLHKSHPFENWIGDLVFLIAGAGVLCYVIVAARPVRLWPIALTLSFGIFAFIKAPYAHEYYLLPAIAALPFAWPTQSWRLVSGLNAFLGALMVLANGPIGGI